MNARLYSQYLELQAQDNVELFQLMSTTFKWGNLANEIVMDIGCGPGTNGPKMLLKMFPALQKVIGIDSNFEMIELAKNISCCPRIEYFVFNIEKDSIPAIWESKISKIVSIYCLHWIRNQKVAFQRIFNLLRPDGMAALIFALSSSFWEFLPKFLNHPKWKHIIQDLNTNIPESHFKQFGDIHYRQMLEEVGFVVIHCKVIEKSYKFSTQKDFAGFITSICAFTNYIPAEKLEEFQEDLFDEYKKCMGCNSTKTFKYKCLITVFKKQEKQTISK